MNPGGRLEMVTSEQVLALLSGDGLMEVHFQPVTGFDTRAICGAEALFRPRIDGRIVPPLPVIDAAVASGRIRDIGRYVLEQACLAHRQWHDAGHGCVTMMVNVHAAELLDTDLAADTETILERHRLPPDQLVFELTETAFIEIDPIVHQNLADLRRLGVGLALDDFGTGYSSLSHLRTVPLTMVKLDRQFISGVDFEGTDHEIVRNVVRLGHALGLRVVAEGVETAEQQQALAALGCEAWQGFLRSPAITAHAFIGELERGTAIALPLSCADPGECDRLDSFVLRRIGNGRWAHIGGRGRGEGWAGIVEVDEATEPVLDRAQTHRIQHVQHDDQRWLIGPYHPRCAIIISLDDDTVVIFGSMSVPSLPELPDGEWLTRAQALADSTTSVSPAKRLADELEMSEALHGLVSNKPQTLDEAMRHVVSSVAGALSCEFGVLYLPAVGLVAFDDHTIHNVDNAQLLGALEQLAATTTRTVCVQNAHETPLPLPLPSDYGVRSWIALPTSSSFGGLIVCAHTDRGPRGFTALCQKLGRRLAAAAGLVLHDAFDREELQSAVSSASVEARIDALTGLRNRRGWDEAVALCDSVEDRSISILVADLNELKHVNDTYGHPAGDELLIAAARCLSNLVRSDDIVARTGGDEFAVLVRGADVAMCRRFASQLDELLSLERIEIPHLSVAIGYATNDGHESIADTMKRADADMYQAKAVAKREAIERANIDN